jgi:chemotaxis-related protein WspB
MLFLVFQLGKERYALEANRVVEVLPLLEIRALPQSPSGIAGVFMYRGRPVPAIDLSALTLGYPAAERLSTRILVVNYPDSTGQVHLLGLIAENATDVLRRETEAFLSSGITIQAAPYLGPVITDSKGPIQWLHEERLLSEPVQRLLFDSPATLAAAGPSASEFPSPL